MRLPVLIGALAQADFVNVAAWLEGSSGLNAGGRFEQALAGALELLASRPRIGQEVRIGAERLRCRRLRLRPFRRHLVIYRIERECVQVLRIVDGTRNLDSLQTEPGNDD